MSALEHPFDPTHVLSFDLETTGVDPATARIVTSAVVSIRGRDRQDLEMLADPEVDIPASAAQVHGITTEYAREHGRPHDDVLAETIERIRTAWDQGATLVVYNAPYDLSVLRARDPHFTVDGPVFDPLCVDKGLDRKRPGKRTLDNVCAHYNVALDNAHEATADAVAAARVAWKLTRKYPQLVQVSMDELMLQQATWHYEYQQSLKEYFQRIGKDTQVNTAWPISEEIT